jgi:hypothetical protein
MSSSTYYAAIYLVVVGVFHARWFDLADDKLASTKRWLPSKKKKIRHDYRPVMSFFLSQIRGGLSPRLVSTGYNQK